MHGGSCTVAGRDSASETHDTGGTVLAPLTLQLSKLPSRKVVPINRYRYGVDIETARITEWFVVRVPSLRILIRVLRTRLFNRETDNFRLCGVRQPRLYTRDRDVCLDMLQRTGTAQLKEVEDSDVGGNTIQALSCSVDLSDWICVRSRNRTTSTGGSKYGAVARDAREPAVRRQGQVASPQYRQRTRSLLPSK